MKIAFRLGLVSFFADISSEMLYPNTPIFLTAVLGASVFSVGVIEGIAEGIADLLKIYSCVWSDRLQNDVFLCWWITLVPSGLFCTPHWER